jgi:hypothetical protein
LATFRQRLPQKRDMVLAFAFCVFLVFSWSILVFFRKVPYWLLFLDTLDLISSLAYALSFALLESVAILSIWILAGIVLPARFLRERFVALGGGTILVSGIWVIADHTNIIGFLESPLWPLLCLGSLVATYLLIYHSHHLQNILTSLAERLTVLLYLYVPAALASLVIVIIRNLGHA